MLNICCSMLHPQIVIRWIFFLSAVSLICHLLCTLLGVLIFLWSPRLSGEILHKSFWELLYSAPRYSVSPNPSSLKGDHTTKLAVALEEKWNFSASETTYIEYYLSFLSSMQFMHKCHIPFKTSLQSKGKQLGLFLAYTDGAHSLWCVTHSRTVRKTGLLFQMHATLPLYRMLISMNKEGLCLNPQLLLIFTWAAVFSPCDNVYPSHSVPLAIFRPWAAFTSSGSFTCNHTQPFQSGSSTGP